LLTGLRPTLEDENGKSLADLSLLAGPTRLAVVPWLLVFFIRRWALPCRRRCSPAPTRRRDFITLLGGAAAAWPLAARAQQTAMRPTIGFLGSGTPAVQGQWVAAFVQRLRELGWIEGRNLTIEYRWAEGSADRAAELAAEFVRRKVDVIVTYANPMVVATKQATSVIPIVFAAAADPVGTGLVAGLARPGGNVTGLSAQNTDLAGKHLELLRDLIPGLRRLAIMANVDNSASVLEMREVQAAARTKGPRGRTLRLCRHSPLLQPDQRQHLGAIRTPADHIP